MVRYAAGHKRTPILAVLCVYPVIAPPFLRLWQKPVLEHALRHRRRGGFAQLLTLDERRPVDG